MTDDVSRNRRRALVLLAGLALPVALLVAVVLLLVGLGPFAVILGLAAGAGAAVAAQRRATASVRGRTGARPADPVEHARLHNLVEGLCVAAGLTKPELLVIDDPAPNALVAGTSQQGAVLAVTTGLLASLDRIELEGVLAHELSHIRRADIVPATVAVTTIGLLAGPLPGLHQRLLDAALGERRSVLADVAAVEMTRYPPGLIAALEELATTGTAVGRDAPAMAHLWIGAPAGAPTGADASHPPLEERIATLREL